MHWETAGHWDVIETLIKKNEYFSMHWKIKETLHMCKRKVPMKVIDEINRVIINGKQLTLNW